MNDPIAELGKLLQDAGATVKFGLRAQGHLPTIERMLDEGASWHAIGRAIGWSKHAACEYYTIHLREDAKAAQAAWVAALAALRAALKSCEEATCANFDAVSAERAAAEIRRLRAEVEQAQQERDAARETVTAVMVRLVPVVSDAAIVGKTYGHYDVVGIVEQAVADLAAAKADVAQPPALPPLPEGWVREGVRDIILYRSHDRYTGVDGHVPPGGQVSVHAEGLRVSTTHVPVADLLIVLRHAEAAHLTLQEGK